MRVGDVLETCLYASDLDAAERFYTSVLGLERIGRAEGRHVFFRCGGRVFLVFDPGQTRAGDAGVPAHGAAGPGHVCFAVPEAELDSWRGRLRAHGVEIEAELTWPKGGRSLYFRDPAGNCVEIGTPRIWGIEEAEALGGKPVPSPLVPGAQERL